MSLPKRYQPSTIEPQLQTLWQASGIYHFDPGVAGPVYSIDTPPPTVSGHLHLGHVYSYSQTDFMARFWRMNGYHVFYPMGYDDNGLPTERLVEKRLGIRATEVGRQAFIEKCLQVSVEAEKDYEALWQRLGLSIDWRYTYRTIDDLARRTAQLSFIDLYRKGLAYRQKAPAIWCPECRTAIAEAELSDLDRESAFYTLAFRLENGETLPIATTRPELLPACVAVFVHPDDARFQNLVGQQVTVPLFGQKVPVMQDHGADPQKGTGAVMCCTFGDTADVQWWYTHHLPLVEAIGPDGRMTDAAGEWSDLKSSEARKQIVKTLEERGLLLGQQHIPQSVRVHERCDTPVEYIVTQQWFVHVLEFKRELLEAGEKIAWHPAHMQARYRDWIEGLKWDWCISRQRYFGVPFPVWYCDACGAVSLADEAQLPVDPFECRPASPCKCGGTSFTPEQDVMDTWATSSLSPQIVGRWLADEKLYARVFPFSLRPQAHEIIRTWAFYTITKAQHHFRALPWKEVAISGWGLAPEGTGKISKSRGGGPIAPIAMIEKYSADAVRYWAASTSFGKDSVISEDKVQAGAKLVTKLWNVAQFSQRFLEGYLPSPSPCPLPPPMLGEGGGAGVGGGIHLSLADRWILSRTQRLIRRVTDLFRDYEYATAKSETEAFFWKDLADNYLEMAKLRLYEGPPDASEGARYTLYQVLLTMLKLFAPILPYVTEQIYRHVFAPVAAGLVPAQEQATTRVAPTNQSIHLSRWPTPDETLEDDWIENVGEALIEAVTTVRRYKTEHGLALGAELARLQLATQDPKLAEALQGGVADIKSITRAQQVEIVEQLDSSLTVVKTEGTIAVALESVS
jgi:valyl-tRNA synthetase